MYEFYPDKHQDTTATLVSLQVCGGFCRYFISASRELKYSRMYIPFLKCAKSLNLKTCVAMNISNRVSICLQEICRLNMQAITCRSLLLLISLY